MADSPTNPHKQDSAGPTPEDLAGIPAYVEGQERSKTRSRVRPRRSGLRTGAATEKSSHGEPTADALAGIPACPAGREDSKI